MQQEARSASLLDQIDRQAELCSEELSDRLDSEIDSVKQSIEQIKGEQTVCRDVLGDLTGTLEVLEDHDANIEELYADQFEHLKLLQKFFDSTQENNTLVPADLLLICSCFVLICS